MTKEKKSKIGTTTNKKSKLIKKARLTKKEKEEFTKGAKKMVYNMKKNII